jgi:hypothetical protein
MKKLKEKICKLCGKVFLTSHHNKAYCSNICCNRAKRYRYQERYKKQKVKIVLFCVYCGNEIKDAKKASKRYCNPNCGLLHRKEKIKREEKLRLQEEIARKKEQIDFSKIKDMDHYKWYLEQKKKRFPGVISPYGNLFSN